jgi:hypothetical protein
VQGYFNYDAVPGNLASLNSFRQEVSKRWFYALRRRGQKHPIAWERFGPLIARWLPIPTHLQTVLVEAAKMAPRLSPALAQLYDQAKQKGNANRNSGGGTEAGGVFDGHRSPPGGFSCRGAGRPRRSVKR